MRKRPSAYRGKRVFDLAVLFLTSPVTLPVGIATAAVIKVTDGAPVLFRQERAGFGGEPFNVLKFRTMRDAHGADGQQLPDRERVTRVGRALRRSSLDEIPQLISVLRGEMSIVGPRPLYMRYVPYYSPREITRLNVLPGVTGLAQVSGRNAAGWRKRLELDVQYVEHNNISRDVRICLRTVSKALRSEGVSIIAGDSGDPLDVERGFPSQDGLHLRKLYQRDLPVRVEWMNDVRIRRHMTLPEGITLRSTIEWYSSIKSDTNRQEYALEDERGRVVAMTGLRAQEASGPSEFYIFVDPNQLGRGFGRLATELTIQQARRTGTIPSITLTVARDNLRALRIYTSLGFVQHRANDERLWMTLPLGGRDNVNL